MAQGSGVSLMSAFGGKADISTPLSVGESLVTSGGLIAAASYLNIKMARLADGPNERIAVKSEAI